MPASPYKGIYVIYINNKPYVGKDSNIFQTSRFTNHLALLRNGTHNNQAMQEDFNTYGEESIIYSILCFSRNYDENTLRTLEQKYVEKLDSFNNGYNDTLGGVGMWGYKYSDEQKENASIKMTGEDNPTSKLKNSEFYEIVDLFKKGYTNDEIADMYGLHSRYISLIRHKKRFKRLWNKIDYTPKKSTKGLEKRIIKYNTYLEIMAMFENGGKNLEVEEKYNLSSGTGSRLKNGKLYKDFYQRYQEEKAI